MLKTGQPNINNKNYWDEVYGDEVKRAQYESQGTDHPVQVGYSIAVGEHTERFIRAVKEVSDEQKVLDIGCGVGAFTKRVKARYCDCEVWGVDISETVIEANRQLNPNIKYLQGYIGQLGFLPKDYFDLVFTGETLEHLDDPSLLIKDAFSALKKGGKLILTTPFKDAVHSGEHVWYFEKEDVKKLFKDNGFSCKFVNLPDTEYLKVIFAIGVKQ